MNRILLVIGLILFTFQSANSQHFPIEVSEIYKSNNITHYQGQNLILIDFWATWCGPCKAATKQIEVLQSQLKDELFVISITDEEHDKVEKYMQNNTNQLMIACDVGGFLIRQFKVHSRPYAILLNNKGKILLQGHPSKMTYKKIKSYTYRHRQNQTLSKEDIIKVREIEVQKEIPVELAVERIANPIQSFTKTKKNVEYYGSISQLIAELYKIPNAFISMEQVRDLNVHLQSPREIWENTPDSIAKLLKKQFNIRISTKHLTKKVSVLKVIDHSKLWSTEQIDWGKDNIYDHLAGEERVQADNVSILDLSIILSNLKNEPYMYLGNDHQVYDWDVHFLYKELMQNELLEEFGIEIEEKLVEVKVYNIAR